jgi:hypothetical protein
MHPMQDYFWNVFRMYYNLICIFICTPICTKKFYSCKNWVLQFPSSGLSAHATTRPPSRRPAQLAHPGGRLPPRDAAAAELRSEPPPRQAAMAAATFPTSPSFYGRPLPLLNPDLNRDLQLLYVPPPLIPTARPFLNSLPGAQPLSPPPAPIKGEHPPRASPHLPSSLPPLLKLELPSHRPSPRS